MLIAWNWEHHAANNFSKSTHFFVSLSTKIMIMWIDLLDNADQIDTHLV